MATKSNPRGRKRKPGKAKTSAKNKQRKVARTSKKSAKAKRAAATRRRNKALLEQAKATGTRRKRRSAAARASTGKRRGKRRTGRNPIGGKRMRRAASANRSHKRRRTGRNPVNQSFGDIVLYILSGVAGFILIRMVADLGDSVGRMSSGAGSYDGTNTQKVVRNGTRVLTVALTFPLAWDSRGSEHERMIKKALWLGGAMGATLGLTNDLILLTKPTSGDSDLWKMFHVMFRTSQDPARGMGMDELGRIAAYEPASEYYDTAHGRLGAYDPFPDYDTRQAAGSLALRDKAGGSMFDRSGALALKDRSGNMFDAARALALKDRSGQFPMNSQMPMGNLTPQQQTAMATDIANSVLTKYGYAARGMGRNDDSAGITIVKDASELSKTHKPAYSTSSGFRYN